MVSRPRMTVAIQPEDLSRKACSIGERSRKWSRQV
jgi:hypothetical protein